MAFQFLENCSNISFDHVKVKSLTGVAIHFKNFGQNFRISNCHFENLFRPVTGNGRNQPQPTGILFNGSSSAIVIDSCSFFNIIDLGSGKKSHAIYLSNVNDAIIKNSTFEKDDQINFHKNQSGGIQVYYGHSKNVSIQNNQFENVHVHLAHGEELKFVNNHLLNSRLVVGADNVMVNANQFKLSKEAGGLGLIRNTGNRSKIRITKNKFFHLTGSSPFSYAIQLYDHCNQCEISNNEIDNFHTGILLGQASKLVHIIDCQITKNTIALDEDSHYGINIRSGYNNTIENNIFENKTSRPVQSIRDIDSYEKKESNRIFRNKLKGKKIKNATRNLKNH